MNSSLSTLDIAPRTFALLKEQRGVVQQYFGLLFMLFGLTNLARAVFPGMYVFDPFDLGWLLIPEALVFGPVVALLHHRLMGTGKDFAWSQDNRTVKLLKASAYYYVLLILFLLGFFVATQIAPSLLVFFLGRGAAGFAPIVVGTTFLFFLLVYVRLVLVYPVLAGEEREPLIVSMGLTQGKTRQIVSCLLLLGSPVLIPWMAVNVFGGDWLNPSVGPGIRIVPILVRSLLQSVGIILISTGLCTIYKALIAEAENKDAN